MSSWVHELWDSVVYPWKDSRWLSKLWPLPVIALIPVVGFLSVILYKGWRLNTVRKMLRTENTLPELDLLSFLRRGLLLWAFTLLYWLVPGLLCLMLGIGGLPGFVNDVSNIGGQTLQDWAVDESGDWLLSVVIYLLWAIISLPVYQAGMIRYAAGGSWQSMLNVPANTMLVIRHAPSFTSFYINWLVLSLAITLASMLISFTVVGVPLLPAFVLTAYYVSTARELGLLARKIYAADTLNGGGSLSTSTFN